VPILLGLGLDEFSVGAGSILKTRKNINSLSFKEMQSLAEKAIKCESEQEVKELLRKSITN
ncbi:phosphoenolpyruvate--protein phosphotransferase, partial [Mycoplasmopsis bovis]